MRGLAVHRSRPTCRFGTDCQSPVVALRFGCLLIEQADLSYLRWDFSIFLGKATGSVPRRPAAAPLVLLSGVAGARLVPSNHWASRCWFHPFREPLCGHSAARMGFWVARNVSTTVGTLCGQAETTSEEAWRPDIATRYPYRDGAFSGVKFTLLTYM